ncbi:MAG: BamA/TamA family outer membrane protein [Deltaproteobacteria bacterium]|nr:BamA/TamA family outer membrane protein [Deltaproteobacteria bacterium]
MRRARVNPQILPHAVICAVHAVKAPRRAPLGLVSDLVLSQLSNSRAVLWVLLGVLASGAGATAVAAEGDDDAEGGGPLQERRERREAADRQRREDDRSLAPPPVVSDVHFEIVDDGRFPVVQRIKRVANGRGDNAVRTAMAQEETTGFSSMPFLRLFSEHPPLDIEHLDEDGLAVELWYAHNGYFDAKVMGWEVETLREARALPWLPHHWTVDWLRRPEAVRLTGYIEEGPAVTLREITVTGLEEQGRPLQIKVERSVDDLVGDTFTLSAPYDLAALIETLLQDQSYARAEAEVQVQVYPELGVADVRIVAIPGPFCRFGEVTLTGNVAVDPALIEEHIKVEEGKAWSPQDLKDTQTALFNLGTFAVVQTLPDLSVPSNTIPVEVRVTESRFRRARFGGGFSFESNSAELRARSTFSHTNLGGRLIRLEAAAEGGVKGFTQNGQASAFTLVSATRGIFEDRTEALDSVTAATSSRFEGGPVASLSTSLVVPSFLGQPALTLTPKASVVLDRDVGQVTRSLQVAPALTWRANRYLSFTPSLNAERWNTELEFTDEDNPQLSDKDLDYTLIYWRLQATLDHRDHPIYTRRGYYAQFGVSDAGRSVLPGLTFTKAEVDLRGYTSVMRPTRATLATRVAVRVAVPWGDDPELSFVPYNELYFMGGPDTVRGWAADYMSSRACFTRSGEDINGDGVADGPLADTDCYTVSPDEPSLEVYPRGSQAVMFGTVEYRISGPFSIDYAAFVDVGSFIPDLNEPDLNPLKHIYPSVGVGMRYRSPIGPLRLDVGYRLVKPTGQFAADRRWAIHLAFQEAF